MEDKELNFPEGPSNYTKPGDHQRVGKKLGHKTIPMALIIAEFKAGKSTKQIAEQYHVSVSAITERCRKNGFSVVALKAFQEKKADILAFKQSQIIESMSPEKIKAASLRDAATTFNILHNAERLERGQSTENINMQSLNMQLTELDEEELKLRQKLEALGG